MRGVVMHAPSDLRVEDRPDPRIEHPTDAIIKVSAACVCGSDLWPYRGIEKLDAATPMGHEYVGTVEEVGSEVTTLRPGQFVVGSFWASDNTCEICRAGYQVRVPLGLKLMFAAVVASMSLLRIAPVPAAAPDDNRRSASR
jgi:threonine dehydrogenase-like Zn-dependent dehydrogenase